MKDYFTRTRIGTPRPPQEQKPCPPEERLMDYPPEDFSRAQCRVDTGSWTPRGTSQTDSSKTNSPIQGTSE